MSIIGYARVSTTDQSEALGQQRAALEAAGCERVFEDQASGKDRDGRPEFNRTMDYVREGDTLVVVKLDRLARSARDALNIVHELRDKGVALRVLDMGVDTATPTGKLFVTMLAGFAEFERDMIRDRQRAGIDRAMAEQAAGGRVAYGGPPVNWERHQEILKDLNPASGEKPTIAEVARRHKTSRTHIYNVLRREAARRRGE